MFLNLLINSKKLLCSLRNLFLNSFLLASRSTIQSLTFLKHGSVLVCVVLLTFDLVSLGLLNALLLISLGVLVCFLKLSDELIASLFTGGGLILDLLLKFFLLLIELVS